MAIAGIISCNSDDEVIKEKENPAETVTKASEYFPLKVGNYWVYRNFEIKPDGERIIKRRDTFSITETKTVGKDTFYFIDEKMDHSLIPNGWVKDSMGYLIGKNGVIYISTVNFLDTIYSNDYLINENEVLLSTRGYMEKIDSGYLNKLQAFDNIINFKLKGWMPKKHRNEEVKDLYPRYLHRFFSKGIGLVYFNYYYAGDPKTFTLELESYNLVP